MATTNTSPSSMARISTDPLRNFKFTLAIAHPTLNSLFGRMGFMSVSGLNITTEVIPYREGGMNTTTQKMPGQSDFAPITLSRGLICGNEAMMAWMRQMFTVVQGKGKGGPGQDFRATLTLNVHDHPVTTMVTDKSPVKAQFKIYNAWPTAVAFSDFDAGANAIVVQQMTLAHEGFEMALARSTKASDIAKA